MPKDTLFWFKSPVGTFWIAPQPGRPGRFWLGVGEVPLGSYVSPEQAADDVNTRHTGHHAWDDRKTSSGDPRELADWTSTARGSAYLEG